MFYLHVPKTGGQTLGVRLASAFDPAKVHLMQGELVFPRDVQKLTQLIEEKQFIESHVAGAMLLDRPGLQVLCTVRDPVQQMISNWRHMRREPDSRWHRAVFALSADQFFENFGDYFRNHQTNYILSAFAMMRGRIDQVGYYRALNEKFRESLERIRWLVPTESIDEFVNLWALESKRDVPNKTERVNIAPDSGPEVAEARAAIQARPDLYAYDQLLYRIARDRFEAYRREMAELVAPWSYPDNSRRAYRPGSGGVWLTSNWYDPEVSGEDRAWWSGPGRVSEVRVWRANGERVLKFRVTGVNGIDYRDIVAKSKRTFQDLDITRTPVPNGSGMDYFVRLDTLLEQDALLLVTPECFASIMTTKDDPSLTRRSFIASDWSLIDDIPA
jgi:hypothetical protein